MEITILCCLHGEPGDCLKVVYCYALKMITVVIETFARCQLYRLLWP